MIFKRQCKGVFEESSSITTGAMSIWKEIVKHKPHIRAVAVLDDTEVDVTVECAIPDYGTEREFELPVAMTATFAT